MEVGAARSVYILVSYTAVKYTSGLYEVKVEEESGKVKGEKHELLNTVANFFDKTKFQVPNYFVLESARFCSSSKLYLLINEGPQFAQGWTKGSTTTASSMAKAGSLRGYIFDTNSRSLDAFKPPQSLKRIAVVISAYDKLYHLADPICFPEIPKPSFERYDPNTDSWETLPPFPLYSKKNVDMEIVGYAVGYGCILVSINSPPQFMVFHVASRKWHKVNIPKHKSDCCYYPFRGRAVIVGNTIYAMSIQYGKVIAFSLRMGSKSDGSTIYSLEKPSLLRGLKSGIKGDNTVYEQTEYLVHLGDLKFCLAQTIMDDLTTGRQPLWITTFRVINEEGGGRYIKTLHSTVRDVSIKGFGKGFGRFTVDFSFTPEVEDFEPKERGSVATMKQPKEESALISEASVEDKCVSVNEEESDSINEEETEEEEMTIDELSIVDARQSAKGKGTAKKRGKELSVFHRSLKVAKSGNKKRKRKNVS